jgi:hypothetical protein
MHSFTKYATEIVAQSMTWPDSILAGRTITAREVKAWDESKNDVTATLVPGGSGGAGAQITWTVQGGTPSEVYFIDAIATLNTGEKSTQRLRMMVPRP